MGVRGTVIGLRIGVWMALAAILLVGAYVTRLATRWPAIYIQTGPSMEPTVAEGEWFLAFTPAGRVAPGDLVLFRFEDADGQFDVLRRVAGLPGDTVAMESGRVMLNGEPQGWPFLIGSPQAAYSEFAIEGWLYDWGPWVVPADSLLLLSDRRDMLGWPDSRFLGFVPVAEVLAKAEVSLSGSRLR